MEEDYTFVFLFCFRVFKFCTVSQQYHDGSKECIKICCCYFVPFAHLMTCSKIFPIFPSPLMFESTRYKKLLYTLVAAQLQI